MKALSWPALTNIGLLSVAMRCYGVRAAADSLLT
jgi:hypothetical protein